MIRPFDWRDLGLLHRLRGEGLGLDSQQACSHGAQALQHALLGAFAPQGLTVTLVARPPGGAPAAAQFVQRGGEGLARMTFFAPGDTLSQPSGQALLEAVCQAAGARGARNLIAEVDEDGPAFEDLRRAGFAIYARQLIWLLQPVPADPGRRPAPRRATRSPASADATWRSQSHADSPAIHFLYLNLVPALVQQIEPPPARGGRGLVHWREGELLGYIDLDRGPRGVWAQPYFHPAAEKPEELLRSVLQRISDGRARPLYVCVRSYQSWMTGPLESLGFEACRSEAVMVKRLAATVRRPALAPLPALEGTRPEPTAPIARLQRRRGPPHTRTGS